jgi:hypothetical protein
LCHKLLEDARLFDLKKRFDEDLAAKTKAARCPQCGGRLDVADYPRKPRGGPDGHDVRLSFCCATDGCRKRATPPSVRFLGRKVYVAAMVVLATTMQQGVTAARLSHLRDLLGVSRRTLRRWRLWWAEVFGQSPFWQAARGRLALTVEEGQLPHSLLEVMGWKDNQREALVRLLRFIAPVSARPGLSSLPI